LPKRQTVPPLFGCPRLLIQYIQYPPYWRPFLHPQPADVPWRGDRDPLFTILDMTTTQSSNKFYTVAYRVKSDAEVANIRVISFDARQKTGARRHTHTNPHPPTQTHTHKHTHNVTNMSEKQVLNKFWIKIWLSLLFPTVQEPSCLCCSSVLSSTVCDLLTTLPFTIIKTAVFLWSHFWYEISYCNLPQLALFRILPHCQQTVTLLFWESNLI
jgi:hypothetical protein